MSDLKSKAVYPIGAVEELTQLTARQIRYYEENGLVKPVRTQGNRRLYTPENVERLLAIKDLLAQGLSLKGVQAYFQEDQLDPNAHPPQVPEIDHEQIISQMRQGRPLQSLYPIDNREALIRKLADKRRGG